VLHAERISIINSETGIQARRAPATAWAVASLVDPTPPGASLLPLVENLRAVSATVAVEVAKTVAAEGLARAQLTDVVQQVQDVMWQPGYPQLLIPQEARA
jgi:malate dehydrogenase (oxaloacetate-decarboxylating)